MLVCDQPIVEKWTPNFSSSGLPNPVWTRLKFAQTVLCNSLEWTEWATDPVQVEICDACGTVGCASGGYVRISALGQVVLWTMPTITASAGEVGETHYPATAIEKYGAVAIPAGEWDSLHLKVGDVPESGRIARADGSALRDAWAVGQTRPRDVERLLPMLQACLLASDNLDALDAIHWIRYWLCWLEERAGRVVTGKLRTSSETGATIERLYFEGPGSDDWTGLAKVGDSYFPAFSPDHIFMPG
jgi:hypothetical protein